VTWRDLKGHKAKRTTVGWGRAGAALLLVAERAGGCRRAALSLCAVPASCLVLGSAFFCVRLCLPRAHLPSVFVVHEQRLNPARCLDDLHDIACAQAFPKPQATIREQRLTIRSRPVRTFLDLLAEGRGADGECFFFRWCVLCGILLRACYDDIAMKLSCSDQTPFLSHRSSGAPRVLPVRVLRCCSFALANISFCFPISVSVSWHLPCLSCTQCLACSLSPPFDFVAPLSAQSCWWTWRARRHGVHGKHGKK